MSMFVTPGELIRFIRWRDHLRCIVYDIDETNIFTACQSVIRALSARGLVTEEFFAELIVERPYLRPEIEQRRKWAGV